MPVIAQKCIEAIRLQVDLADAVGPYVPLKRVGKSWKGLSPFTNEKTPSFYVHPDKGFYKCFSTGKGGDIFTFFMEVENLSFPEAIEFIARRFNIPIEYDGKGPDKAALSIRKQLFDVHAFCVEWFHKQFMESTEAEPIRDYWQTKRGFSLDAAERWKIGYAPAGREPLLKALLARNTPIEVLAKSGLFFGGEDVRDPSRLLARFRGRLMIPIRDVQGRPVAFTARQLDVTPQDDPAREAKYVNSPETYLFNKGKLLFGLDHARTHIPERGTFLLVEGQLDAIRCWENGVHTAIAPQGTALTEDQLELLRRYDPSTIEVLLDGDKAGRAAALRSIPLAFKVGLELAFLPLPEKTDPDDLFREHGASALENLRKSAQSPLQLIVSTQLPPGSRPTAREKTQCMHTLFEHIQLIQSEVEKDDLLNTAASLLKADPLAVHRDFREWKGKQVKPQSVKTKPEANGTPHSSRTSAQLLTCAEGELLWLLFNFSEYTQTVAEIIDHEWIETEQMEGRMLSRLLAEVREGLYEGPGSLNELLETSEERTFIADLQTKELQLDEPHLVITECITRIHRKFLKKALGQVNQQILNADSTNGEDLLLMRERKELYKQLNHSFELKPAEAGE